MGVSVAHALAGSTVLMALVAQLAGCYSYVPVVTDAPPIVGERYALQISDQGRVGLAERFGSGLSRVEGRLTQVSPLEFALSVFRVEHVGGQSSTWAGESVRIDRGYVGRIDSRKFSRGRTTLAVGAATVAIGYFIVSRGLLGFYTGDQQEPTIPGPESSVGLTRISR